MRVKDNIREFGEDHIDYEAFRQEEQYKAWIDERKENLSKIETSMKVMQEMWEELDSKRLALLTELKGHV